MTHPILITGAGFIGSHLCEKLPKMGVRSYKDDLSTEIIQIL